VGSGSGRSGPAVVTEVICDTTHSAIQTVRVRRFMLQCVVAMFAEVRRMANLEEPGRRRVEVSGFNGAFRRRWMISGQSWFATWTFVRSDWTSRFGTGEHLRVGAPLPWHRRRAHLCCSRSTAPLRRIRRADF